MYCYNCSKEIKQGFRLKIIDEHGNIRYENCCSLECCEQTKNNSITFLESKINDIKYQSFQPLYY